MGIGDRSGIIGITFGVTATDRVRLETIVAGRSSPQKHVWRWQERFMAEGVEGLLRDKSRPPGIAPLYDELVERVVALTLDQPRQEATHWTVRAMAKTVGIAASSVVKIRHGRNILAPTPGGKMLPVGSVGAAGIVELAAST